MYPASVGQQQIEAHHAWTENVANYPQGSSIIFWSYLPVVEDIVILAAYEDTAGNVSPPGFEKFMAINSTTSTMRIASHKELTDELEQPTGYRSVPSSPGSRLTILMMLQRRLVHNDLQKQHRDL